MTHYDQSRIMEILGTVSDPEIPVISILDLGIVRNIDWKGDAVAVTITPTYTGCPAMKEIEEDIRNKLSEEGFHHVEIKTVFKPAWTTDWMSEEALGKLKEYGISPPHKVSASDIHPFLNNDRKALCPLCNSEQTELKSFFGSTACKALYMCHGCMQPFEHFKCI